MSTIASGGQDGGVAPGPRRFRARWVLPISQAPLHGADIVVEAGRIVSVEPARPVRKAVDLGSMAILPGLVNAHTHLELSVLRGRVAPAKAMTGWVRAMLAARADAGTGTDEDVRTAILEAQSFGTVLIGDITNTLATVDRLHREDVAARVFYELLGFGEHDASGRVASARQQLGRCATSPRLTVGLAAHAPYSVSPELFGAIREAAGGAPYATHLAESPEEVEFLRTGGGPWRTLLEDLGAWNERWTAPRCGPIEYMERVGFLGPQLVMAHGVQLTPTDLRRVAGAGATIVTCPRSNAWTGAGEPPVEAFFESGASMAVGTDSLASCPDLNVFSELRELRRLAPTVPPGALLQSATLNGARALGFGATFGSIDPGKSDRLITVVVPDSETAVEEYLLSGIEAGQIAWLGDVA